MKQVIIFFLLTFTFKTLAQPILSTIASERLDAVQRRNALLQNSLVAEVPFKNIGPTIMSGRVVDIEVKPDDPTVFYVAYASGGLWKTENNGASFAPIFDKEAVMTIGDIAVNWKTKTIWVGTGENNSSRSSYSGVGIFKSEDDGKTWQHKGLEESHHIGRILLDPNNDQTIYVAVLGHLYSSNEERGVYKSLDGGNTWKKTLFINNETGAIDLVFNPNNSNILYAALWERQRSAWNFKGNGSNSGIWISQNAGNTWSRLDKNSGFPQHEFVGRIGLTTAKNNDKTVLYAIYDDQTLLPLENKNVNKNKLDKKVLRNITKEQLLAIPKEKLTAFLEDNEFPEKYSYDYIVEKVKKDELKPTAIIEYIEDANTKLIEGEVVGPQIYRSDDEGKTWKKTHDVKLDNIFNTYGYYFGQIRVAPYNINEIYFAGVPILISKDGGKTFENIDGDNVHGDHHALWVNPNKPGHLINGNDGGINISYDFGKNWVKCNTPAVGQFYAITTDQAEPYNVYGGLQDNGVWSGPSNYKAGTRWHDIGKYPYQFLLGGDGMQVQVDPRDNNTVYAGFQFGFYYRINKTTRKNKFIQPKHILGERPLRYNWQTPILLSSHQSDVLYLGANKLYRSMDKGDNWEALSEDLTKGGKEGNVPYGTLTTIHESPLKFGLIYTGSDDGLVFCTKDGGVSWQNCSIGLPEGLWVSRVQASYHNKSTVYVSLNGYRNDHFSSYLYQSDDYGATWKKIGNNLPIEPINVVKEDPASAMILYIGTDYGVYVSLDKGLNFMKMGKNLPNVAVHDLVIQNKANELVVGTHGRSIYTSSIQEIRKLSEHPSETLQVFELKNVDYDKDWGNSYSAWSKPEETKVSIPFYTSAPKDITLKISKENIVLQQISIKSKSGIQYADYDLSMQVTKKSELENLLQKDAKDKTKIIELKTAQNGKLYLPKGKYDVEVSNGSDKKSTNLVID